MRDSTRSYRAGQLARVGAPYDGDIYRLKVIGDGGETHWLSVTTQELARLMRDEVGSCRRVDEEGTGASVREAM